MNRYKSNDTDLEICCFILPILQKYKKENNGCFYRKSFKETQFIVQRMIDAFEIHLSAVKGSTKSNDVKVLKGLELFAKHFQELWL